MSVKKTIARSFTVETIEDGISVQAQYAPNANPTSSQIHNVWQDGDLFMRTRETDSTTWSAWHRIVGENGGETDYSFGISQYRTTENAQTAPSDISSWSDAPLAVTTTKPYLWSKVQQKSWNESTQQYVVDSTRYIRLTGEEGVVYDIQTPVDSIHIGENQTSATLSGTAKFYKKEGTKDKVQTVFYYGVYKRTGTTFTKVATGNANSYAFSNLSVANTVNAVVIYLFASSYTGTDPESQTYLCKREMLVVDAGNSPYFADLDNEMDSIACANDGKPSSEQTVETNVKLYRGSTALSPTLAVNDDSPSGAAYTSGTAKDGITVTWNNTTGNIKFKFGTSNSRTKTETFCITLTVTDNGATITRYLYFTVNCIRAALDGNPAALYRLVPSVNEIVKKKDGTYVPTGTSYITCGVTKNVGGTQSTPAASEYVLKYSLNGGAETTYTATSVRVNQVTSNLVFILYVNSIVVDRETIGIINDGIDGTSPYFADLDNEMDSIACTHDGKAASAQSVVTNVSMFKGSSAEAFTVDKIYRNGTQMSWDGNNNGVWPRLSGGTVTLEFDSGAAVNVKDDFKITLYATNATSVTRELHFIVNGVRANAIYRLVPSHSEIVKKKDGTYNPSGNVTCSVVKIENGVESTPASTEYTLKKSVNGGSEVAYSATAANTITSDLKFILYVNSQVVDKETIPLVSDGDEGKGYKAVVTRNNFTESNWATYGTLGHSETWSDTSSIRGNCKTGDWFIVVGTATDTKNYHVATYQCTNDSGNLAGTCINHQITKDGQSYCFVFTSAFAKTDENGIVSAALAGYAYKYVGSERVALTGVTIRYGYILNDSDTYADTTTNNSGYFDAGDWFNGDDISTYGKNSPSIFAAIIIGGSIVCSEFVTISEKGETGNRGKTGRFYYYGGEFDENDTTKTFKINDAETPYFSHGVNAVTGLPNCHVYNPSTNPSSDLTMAQMWANSSQSWNHAPWQTFTNDFQYLMTRAVFSDQAYLGSFVVNTDWLISQHGKVNHVASTAYTKFYPEFVNGGDLCENFDVNVNYILAGSAYFIGGKKYYIKVVGSSFSSGCQLNVRMYNGSSNVGNTLNLTASSPNGTITFEPTTSGTYYVRADCNAGGQTAKLTAYVECFVPNFAVDGLTGKTYQNDAFIKGNIYRPALTINNSNYSTYAPKNQNDVYVIDLKKTGLNILLDFNLSSGTLLIDLPYGDEYIGAEVTIINHSNKCAYIETILWGEGGDSSFPIYGYSGYAHFKYVKVTNSLGNTVGMWWVLGSIYDPGNYVNV